VDDDVGDARVAGEPDERLEVLERRVHAAVAHQADEVQALGVAHGGVEHRVGLPLLEQRLVDLVRSCLTTAPAPRLRWPTSLLPICPSGRPTAFPHAVSVVCGYVLHSPSKTGVSASSTALPGPGGASPQPSRTTRRAHGTAASSPRGRHDRRERLGLERGAADERAVDVGQREQLLGVLGLDAAAVEDADLLAACLSRSATSARTKATASWACSGVATLPVPIAQIGSYAMTTSCSCSAGTSCEPLLHLRAQLALGVAALALLLGLADAEHRDEAVLSAAGTFCCSALSVSPNSSRRSEWPSSTPSMPTSQSIRAETSPVYGPPSDSCMVCAKTSIAESCAASTTR
jgi:hypothetical protein